jgi:hypothetical protein
MSPFYFRLLLLLLMDHFPPYSLYDILSRPTHYSSRFYILNLKRVLPNVYFISCVRTRARCTTDEIDKRTYTQDFIRTFGSVEKISPFLDRVDQCFHKSKWKTGCSHCTKRQGIPSISRSLIQYYGYYATQAKSQKASCDETSSQEAEADQDCSKFRKRQGPSRLCESSTSSPQRCPNDVLELRA